MATTHCYFKLVLLFISFSSPAFSQRCHPDDKNALLQIKKDLNNPSIFISWDPNTDCCTWNNTDCDHQTNRIITVSVISADLSLPLPPSVARLSHLEILIFRATNLTGQIPQAITRLFNLKFLDLSQNLLAGPVPSFLSQLQNLNYIKLSSNFLSGSIPASLSQVPTLRNLLLDGNKLMGKLPESFADFQLEYFHLDLSNNHITGTVPRKWGDPDIFSIIDMSGNMIKGDVSFLFGKNKSVLNYVDFSRNRLRFDMSKLEFGKSLRTLDLSHNMITGRLPEGLLELENLNMNVSYNKLCGRIPVGGNLQALSYTAYFHNKCLCGAPLPGCK